MKISGTITDISPVFEFTAGGKDCRKKLFTIKQEVPGKELQHPDTIAIALMNEQIDDYHDIEIGDSVTVIYDCNAKIDKIAGKAYNDCYVYKIDFN